MDFDKKETSSKVMEFLKINLKEDEDKKSFSRLLRGNKLLYKEANDFIETLLRALVINDGKEDPPFVPRKYTEDLAGGEPINPFSKLIAGEEKADEGEIPEDETLTQHTKNANVGSKSNQNLNVISNNKKVEKMIEKMVGSKKEEHKNSSKDTSDRPLCRFFVKGNCRNKENCKFDHPKICYKFKANGLRALNEKGCDNKECQFLHPNACRDSLKNRTCQRSDCRFFHLTGTKIVPRRPFSANKNFQNERPNFESKNRFDAFKEQDYESSQKTSQNQVFHKAPQEEPITLKDIMKEIMAIKIRQDAQEKYQPNRSDNKVWRNPINTQEQEEAWDSQRRNQSQSQYSQNSQNSQNH